ncbi:MAG: hypothetical protein K9M81_00065 [Chthoniobacterales bacterium]|nr:hypothetical protein [Chthoniobacterales bacterium]
MDAALISKSSSGSMYSYSRCLTSSLALPHQDSRPPRHDQYEISGLITDEKITWGNHSKNQTFWCS